MGGHEGLIILGVAFVVYLLPALIARTRLCEDSSMVVVINVFLGWTIIGWVISLAMAFRDSK